MSSFLFVGEAPSFDFVNTEIIAGGNRVDLLQSFADLERWFAEAGLARPSEVDRVAPVIRSREALLREARKLRAALRSALEAISRGERIPSAPLAVLNRYLSAKSVYEVRARGKRYELVQRERIGSPTDLLTLIARSFAEVICSADLSRIRKCENEKCILYFLDRSKANRRRWCSMSVCGNRAKAAAHYRRIRRHH